MLAFTRLIVGPSTEVEGEYLTSRGVWAMKPDGSGLRRITVRSDWSPSWSPDGTQLALARRVRAGGAFRWDIVVVARDGRVVRKLALGGRSPAWSPNGKEIAFVREDGIYTVSAAGGVAQRVFAGSGIGSLDWGMEPRAWPPPRSAAVLPDSWREVSVELGQQLQLSTARIVARVSGSDNEWTVGCTAARRVANGRVFFTTAGHCFPMSGARRGRYREVVQGSGLEFAVSMRDSRGSEVFSAIGAIYVHNDRVDFAFMIPSPSHDPGLDGVAALPLRTAERRPARGQKARLISYPVAAGGRLVSSTGTYLGRIRYRDGDASRPLRTWDLVGIDPKRASLDACNFGGSGSTGVLADGTVLGALGIRANAGYRVGGVRERDEPAFYDWLITALERKLGLRLVPGEFTTICGYSVAPTELGLEIRQLPELEDAVSSRP